MAFQTEPRQTEEFSGLERAKVQPFAVDRIQLLPSAFRSAMEKDADYLLSLDADRFLHSFRTNAGLPPKGEVYGGWEKEQLAGHSLGHHLSAISRMAFASGSQVLKDRASYIVSELKACQAQDPQGYFAALPDAKPMWDKLRQGDPSGVLSYWAPWYTIHKVFAGLLDAHTHLQTPDALKVAKGLADWGIWVTANLTPENWQAMLENEHGGINESYANIYALTNDEKYLDAANHFYHKAVLDPLSQGIDDLDGLHSNTQIPKVIGCAVLYDLIGEQKHQKIATTFWDKMVHHHTYAIGGNSVNEHLGAPDKLNNTLGPTTCETCNTYNMVKLTNLLFAWNPTGEYADYAERALTNHILASQNHDTGMMCYYVTLQPNTKKVFCTPFNSFWCCTGTGMENHSRYGESIFFQGNRALYVAQFIPSQLDWKENGVKVKLESELPKQGTVRLTIDGHPTAPFTLFIRKPYWSVGEPKLKLNGKSIPVRHNESGFLEVEHPFASGDRIEAEFTQGYHLWPMPDNSKRAAIFYGPTVLAGNLGTGLPTGTQVPALIADEGQIAKWMEPTLQNPLEVITNHVGRPQDYKLIPFNTIENEKTTVYWDFLTSDEWAAREAKLAADAAFLVALNANTIDHFLPGNKDSEASHQVTSQKSGAGEFNGRTYRDAYDGGWMSFQMKADPGQASNLTLTFWGSDTGNRVFDVNIDGHFAKTISLDHNRDGEFYREIIPFTAGTSGTVLVNLQGQPGAMMGGLFGARTLKPGFEAQAPLYAALDFSKTRDPISAHVYGQFMEHLGHCINQGIWSELLLDRKFYYAIGYENSPWHTVNDPQIAMDPISPFVGEHSPAIDVEEKTPAGIFQGDIPFKKNGSYVGYVWLKGDDFAGPIEVNFIWGTNPGDRQTHTIPSLTSDYQKYEFQFQSPILTTAGRLEIVAKNKGRVFVGAASLMPADNVFGMRPDLIDLLKDLDGSLYRWPGGNFVSGYNWKDGIGDRDRRPTRKNPAWDGIEPNDFGAHEYMKLCELVGFEPLVVVNTGLGTVAMATEELEYFNGPKSSKMGRLRAEHGHPDPFNVTWWGIGNEMYGDWQLGHIPLDEYTKKHNQFVDAMRLVDSKIKVIGSGDCYSPWTKGMLDNCWNRLDILSEHFYCQDGKNLLDHVELLADQVRNKVAIHRKLRQTDSIIQAHPVPITFDEYNYWYGQEVYGQLGIRYRWKDGLGVARFLHEVYKNTDIVQGANYAQTINVIGAIKSTPFASWIETTGLVLEMYRRHFGTIPIHVSEPPPNISWSAALIPSENKVAFAVVNPTAEPLRVHMRGLTGNLPIQTVGVELRSDDPMAYNDEHDTNRIKINTVNLASGNGVVFNPMSVTIVHLT